MGLPRTQSGVVFGYRKSGVDGGLNCVRARETREGVHSYCEGLPTVSPGRGVFGLTRARDGLKWVAFARSGAPSLQPWHC